MTGLNKGVLLKYCGWLGVFIVLLSTPLLLSTYYLAMLTSILCWIGLAVSWYFFSGVTKYISLGSAAFFGLGVYVTAVFGRVLPFPATLLLAGVISFFFACGVGLVSLRLRGIFFAIFTYGLAELLNNVILFWEMKVTGTRGRFVTPMDVYYPILLITFAAILSVLFLMRSKIGLALRMIGDNEEAASHFGVNTTLYKILGFAISSSFMGLLGAAFAPRWGYIDSGIAFNPLYSFMPAIMTLFGGVQMFFGPIVGAVILSVIEEYLLTMFKDYFMLILGSIMIIVILALPDGLTGKLLKRAVKAPRMPP